MTVDSLKFQATLGIGGGILLMFLGSAITQASEDGLLLGLPIAFGGFAWEIWGCVNYMRWKGHSGWFGLFGYLLLPGILILACFPNRRTHLPQVSSTEDHGAGYRFLLTLVPLGLLGIGLGGVMCLAGSNIDPAEWKQIAPSGMGFQADMPGTPQLEQNKQQTPNGEIEQYKFSVEPKGRNELFMILSVRFPEDVLLKIGGPEKILELCQQDVLSGSKGQLKSERQIDFNGCPGLEMEVLPPKGAIIKARIYATQNQIYQVSVHVPKIRLKSGDVQKFFESFKLIAKPGDAHDGGGH